MADNLRLDSTDLEILRVLQNDARITNRELAATVGIAASTCLDRVNRMREGGVILGYRLQVSPEALGRPIQAFLTIRAQHRRELLASLAEHIRSQPETRALYHLAGRDDFLVLVAAESVADLQRLVIDELTCRPEITQVQTTLVFQEWEGGPLLPPGARA
ncbi:DNA-binding Lrp family transcriptional regulator [Nocardiopsis mwathae]|uniref:DNA-binding Lrp family transcriptional regulator n=1 Tax=Nocardiopsis mwathae TaxID=1472723 RepID=A0A7W9YG22_9ACTN|nr:Lrp/AsnC family transcriptional regulator [Nocardiopsis mwathae]MBB6171417.1 DNA-binding Lrp family transcriptional regulator [Nocardiopsis mwathae]